MTKKPKAAQEGRPDGRRHKREAGSLYVYSNDTTSPQLMSTPGFRLRRTTRTSAFCDCPALLASWLRVHGYTEEPTTNPHELARLRNGADGVVIIYRSGSIVVGGPASGADVAIALLERRIKEQAATARDFWNGGGGNDS